MSVTLDQLRRVPKVLLHDHLDGGLRPQTVVELAAETGYDRLPMRDVAELGRWMTGVAARGSLELYLEAFEHTVGVMQTRDALTWPRTAWCTRRSGSRPSCT
jgi:adenosine deaminase